MPDREYIAAAFEKLDDIRAQTHFSVLSTFLKRKLEKKLPFSELDDFGRTFAGAVKFLQALDQSAVSTLEESIPEFAGFFSRIPGIDLSFEATCETILSEKAPGALFCEAAQKGDHTLINMLPLLYCFLSANSENTAWLVNKDETDLTGFAYALLMHLKSRDVDFKSAKSVIEFTAEADQMRRLGRGKLSITENAALWLLDNVKSFLLNNKTGLIQDIADLHPASLLAIDRMGRQKVSYLFSSQTPIRYDPSGDDQKNIFSRFERIIVHAREENIEAEDKYFREVFLREPEVSKSVCKHLTDDSVRLLKRVISAS